MLAGIGIGVSGGMPEPRRAVRRDRTEMHKELKEQGRKKGVLEKQ